jgi:hypothetical protein
MAEGHGYVSYTTGQPTAYCPVGYPAMLAALFSFVAHSPLPDDDLLAGRRRCRPPSPGGGLSRAKAATRHGDTSGGRSSVGPR